MKLSWYTRDLWALFLNWGMVWAFAGVVLLFISQDTPILRAALLVGARIIIAAWLVILALAIAATVEDLWR